MLNAHAPLCAKACLVMAGWFPTKTAQFSAWMWPGRCLPASLAQMQALQHSKGL